jgi:hypothetical protein
LRIAVAEGCSAAGREELERSRAAREARSSDEKPWTEGWKLDTEAPRFQTRLRTEEGPGKLRRTRSRAMSEPEMWTAMESRSREMGEQRRGEEPDLTAGVTLKVRTVEPLGAEKAMKACVPDIARPEGLMPNPTQPEGDGAVPMNSSSSFPFDSPLLLLPFPLLLLLPLLPFPPLL